MTVVSTSKSIFVVLGVYTIIGFMGQFTVAWKIVEVLIVGKAIRATVTSIEYTFSSP